MITVQFYKNGAEVTGYDNIEICGIISYATWACACDCQDIAGKETRYYASYNRDETSQDGISWFTTDTENSQVNKLYMRFFRNISVWSLNEFEGKMKFVDSRDKLLEVAE
jgi:hypothetical protein